MAYLLTRAEVRSLIDIVEETTKPSERTSTERDALIKLHQIDSAFDAKQRRNSRPVSASALDDANTHEADKSIGDK